MPLALPSSRSPSLSSSLSLPVLSLHFSDVARGEKIFKTKCAQCHVAEKGGGHKQVSREEEERIESTSIGFFFRLLFLYFLSRSAFFSVLRAPLFLARIGTAGRGLQSGAGGFSRCGTERREKRAWNNRTPHTAALRDCFASLLSSSFRPTSLRLFPLDLLPLSPPLSLQKRNYRAPTSGGSSGASPGPSRASPTPRPTRRRPSCGELSFFSFLSSPLSRFLAFLFRTFSFVLSLTTLFSTSKLSKPNQKKGRRPPSTTTSSTRRSTSLVSGIWLGRKRFLGFFFFRLVPFPSRSLFSFPKNNEKLKNSVSFSRHQDGVRRAQEAPGPHGPHRVPQERDVVRVESEFEGKREELEKKEKSFSLFLFLPSSFATSLPLFFLFTPRPAKGTPRILSPPLLSTHRHFLCISF